MNLVKHSKLKKTPKIKQTTHHFWRIKQFGERRDREKERRK